MVEYSFNKTMGLCFDGSLKECKKYILSKLKPDSKPKEFWIRSKGKEHHYLIVTKISHKAVKI